MDKQIKEIGAQPVQVKVLKFGGSSLADAEHFEKVKEIVVADPSRRFVIPSAPGKRFSNDTKVTDMLYECYNISAEGKDISEIFGKIQERYNLIIEGLGLDLDLTEEYEHIKWAITHHAGRDYAASRGEYLNGIILATYLNYDFIDPAHFIHFADIGVFDAV